MPTFNFFYQQILQQINDQNPNMHQNQRIALDGLIQTGRRYF